jgi:D-lactate dehydrogenase
MSKDNWIVSCRNVVGKKKVLTGDSKTAYYRTGFRYGFGDATAVIIPGDLLELWRVLEIAAAARCAIILQATKTGLTGGSSPSGSEYDRDVVIINTTRIKRIVLLKGGRQALVLPGTTLFELTKELEKIGRVPHSVLGSTMVGATVIGGVANNAGGALCKRGSSYTELSLFARVDVHGKLELVDHLGIQNLGDTPEEIFEKLQHGDFCDSDLVDSGAAASDRDYENRIRNLDSDVPNRYNGDPKRLFDVSGSAGKVAAFAVRVDTYPAPEKKQVFFLGCNSPEDFVTLRKHILSHFEHLPEMCEYLNRSTFNIAERYGKDVALGVRYLGTERLPKAYGIKAKLENLLNKIPFLPKYLPDIFLYYLCRLWPQHLPKRLLRYRDQYKYYLILITADESIDESRKYLQDHWSKLDDVDFFECDEKEQQAVLLHRFSAAGAGIRYQNIHQRTTEEPMALDIALLSSDEEWVESLPDEIQRDLDVALYYGHYLCHVFHHVYVFKKGADLEKIKSLMLKRLDEKCAKYPAEHNFGHLYEADETMKKFFAELDPTNTFNPGIGKTPKTRQPQ